MIHTNVFYYPARNNEAEKYIVTAFHNSQEDTSQISMSLTLTVEQFDALYVAMTNAGAKRATIHE